jgi:hypothetical protein
MQMTYLLCRNRVADFAHWKSIFSSHQPQHMEAGLILKKLWRSSENANNVFFLFEVTSMDKARAFIGSSQAAKVGQSAGVLDGDYYFLDDAGGY